MLREHIVKEIVEREDLAVAYEIANLPTNTASCCNLIAEFFDNRC